MPIFVNNIPVETFSFPGGEVNVRLTDEQTTGCDEITAYLYSSDDIMRLVMTVNAIEEALDANGHSPYFGLALTIPYVPYARQDRVCNSGEAFGVKAMARLINSLGADEVTIYDPHSAVALDFLNVRGLRVVSQAEIIRDSVIENLIRDENLTIVSPDAGASGKATKLAECLLFEYPTLYCQKHRDSKTGALTDDVYVPRSVRDEKLIIVDDICDGGWTFTNLAGEFQKQGAEEIYLYITHGIFSKGLDILRPYFKHIYCYHTFLPKGQIDHEFLTILKDA